jgi:hypothetical protein
MMAEFNCEVVNPFCTRRIRPGDVPYYFSDGMNIEDVVNRLRRNRWRGEITGPHGSGKTTLLRQLLPAVEQAGRKPVLFELHDGQRSLFSDGRKKIQTVKTYPQAIVAVDGYEQLSGWSRFWLRRFCRQGGVGLLVTAHEPTGLPKILCTSISLETAFYVVDQLLHDEPQKIPRDIIENLYAQNGGNIRELLFDLYDVFEQRQHASRQ